MDELAAAGFHFQPDCDDRIRVNGTWVDALCYVRGYRYRRNLLGFVLAFGGVSRGATRWVAIRVAKQPGTGRMTRAWGPAGRTPTELLESLRAKRWI